MAEVSFLPSANTRKRASASREGFRVKAQILNFSGYAWKYIHSLSALVSIGLLCRNWSTTLHNLLFCAHWLCMNYVTNTFLLVRSSIRSKQLFCSVHGQGQRSEQKHTTKNFVGLFQVITIAIPLSINDDLTLWLNWTMDKEQTKEADEMLQK